MNPRTYNFLDRIVLQFDQAVRTVAGHPHSTGRPNPANTTKDSELNDSERLHTIRLMRVNHTGEVCAQALYQGQALTAHNIAVRAALEQSSAEENDHLIWCESRIKQLGGHPSVLNSLFYTASFIILILVFPSL